MRFSYTVLLLGEQLVAAKATSKGWKVIKPHQLPNDKGRGVCVFVGGAGVSGMGVTLPAAREAEVRRAAPFAIEEELATDVADTHFAIGSKQNDSPIRDIRVASKSDMQSWADTLQTYGLRNSPIVFLSDALPPNTLLEAGAHIYGRLGDRPFCLDSDLPPDVFVAMAQGIDDVQLYGNRLSSALEIEPAGQGVMSAEELLLFISEMHSGDDLVNLRQGAFSAKHNISKRQLLSWRPTAALIAVAAVLWFSNLIAGTRAMESRADQLGATLNEILSSEFPEAEGNYNRVIALYQSNNLQSAQPLPSVVDVTALVYKAVGEVEDAQIRSFRYDFQRGEAICVVLADTFAALEVFSDSLRKGGLAVSSGDARQTRNGVVGEFKLGAS